MFPSFRVLMGGEVPFVTNDVQWSSISPTTPTTQDFTGHDMGALSTQAALIPTTAEEQSARRNVVQPDG